MPAMPRRKAPRPKKGILPVVYASHFCNDVVVGVDGNCPSLINIYNTILRPVVPFVLAQLYLFISIGEVRGKKRFRLSLRHLDTDYFIHDEHGDVRSDDPLQTVQIIKFLHDVRFPHAGVYVLELSVDGTLLISRKLNVIVSAAIGSATSFPAQ